MTARRPLGDGAAVGAPDQPLVIGIGNRDRADDGVGPAVVDELRRRGASVATLVREGDLADLAVVWRDRAHVLIVDACRGGYPVGTVRRLDPTSVIAPASWSTHGIGVADAIELARRLDRVPAWLELIGVEGSVFDHGPMSAELADALPRVADEIEALCQSGRRNGAPGWYPSPASDSTESPGA